VPRIGATITPETAKFRVLGVIAKLYSHALPSPLGQSETKKKYLLEDDEASSRLSVEI